MASEILPPVVAFPGQGPSLLSGSGSNALTRLGAITREPLVRRMVPWFVGLGGLGLAALAWSLLVPAPQRVLYSSIDDTDRASIVAALDQAGIKYQIDNDSGTLTVDEDQLYRARMIVASNGAIAAPQDGNAMLDKLPLGASRTLEGDRLRAARERDIELTIAEIDGVEAVRVHLAQAKESVFVQEDLPPSASVMLRLKSGRSISESQVNAIANLVAASVPGLSLDKVRIVDQHGKLLSEMAGEAGERLQYQSDLEAKLRGQVQQLLTPLFGEGRFSTEVQADLDMSETTSARESYDKDGVVRTESQSQSNSSQPGAGGIPGSTTNVAPTAPQPAERAPIGGGDPTAQVQNGEMQSNRTYELGREVAVSSSQPGSLKRLTVAVAIDKNALKRSNQADMQRLEQLISSAVGANPQRGDTVTVISRDFEPVVVEAPAFYETAWFLSLVRYGVAVLGVLLVLIFVARPLVKAAKSRVERSADAVKTDEEKSDDEPVELTRTAIAAPSVPAEQLIEQVELARRIAREKPADALEALRSLLAADAREVAR